MRNRSSAMALTNNTKKKLSSEFGITDNTSEDHKKELITNYIEEKLKNENRNINRCTNRSDYNIDFKPPNYLDIKKEYYTKDEKVFIIYSAYTLS